MLGCVSLTFLEIREIIDYSLHVFNGGELCLALLAFEETLHQVVDVFSDFAEVLVHD
jgi:hypothetical protein